VANNGNRLYSITSSAIASSVGGTVSPSVFAVLRLITSSSLVACTTGRSAGFFTLKHATCIDIGLAISVADVCA
jgi:hypothetical protein